MPVTRSTTRRLQLRGSAPVWTSEPLNGRIVTTEEEQSRFSFPGGIPSHVAPETPGSIHEGGELGYSLAHAFGAAFNNPDLVVFCVVGDRESEALVTMPGPP